MDVDRDIADVERLADGFLFLGGEQRAAHVGLRGRAVEQRAVGQLTDRGRRRTAPVERRFYRCRSAFPSFAVIVGTNHLKFRRRQDAFGRVGRVTDPNGLITTYTHDSRGRITEIDRGGHIITFEYNPNGTLKKITMPEGETLNYIYDDAQRLTEVTDSFGNRIAYMLNSEGRKKKEEIFDSEGTLVKTLNRVFDAYNKLEKLVQPYGTTTYEYDKNGKLLKETDAKGNVRSYSYDTLKRLIRLTEPSPDGTLPAPVTNYEYDALDNLARDYKRPWRPVHLWKLLADAIVTG